MPGLLRDRGAFSDSVTLLMNPRSLPGNQMAPDGIRGSFYHSNPLLPRSARNYRVPDNSSVSGTAVGSDRSEGMSSSPLDCGWGMLGVCGELWLCVNVVNEQVIRAFFLIFFYNLF
ncbi:hypothetical protein JTE90_003291 [Oedothorax gibbosus]|uniref:Uncharacterized protein n=1 Tax=Oedothorax gibbosus TaxID=931172 RepID=A0AAV6V599_9ARAC|nr:hypothetical protein JTE90_003291 [Oedothorax gibbosus]